MSDAINGLDHNSFECIYREYWEAVYAICYQYTECRYISEDLVQEIFQSLWERRKELVIATSVERYLMRAAKLKVFHYLRTSSLQQKHREQAANTCVSENTTENAVLFKELSGAISGLANRLPQQPKNIFILSRGQGLRNSQIAENLSISEKTVKNHLTRALTLLRAGIKKYYK